MTITNKNYLGVGLIGLAIVAFWIFELPLWNRISLLKGAVAEREAILLSRKEILQKVQNLNKQYQERSSDVSKISSLVPSTKNIAELVSTIESISNQTGLQLIEITTGESASQQQDLQTTFLELGLTGSYASLIVFLDLLEKNIRLVDVFEMSISPASALEGQTILNFRVKANAYYLSTNK